MYDQVESRQKILEAIEKEESKEKRSKMNEDAPRELHRICSPFLHIHSKIHLSIQSLPAMKRLCSCSNLLGCLEWPRMKWRKDWMRLMVTPPSPPAGQDALPSTGRRCPMPLAPLAN